MDLAEILKRTKAKSEKITTTRKPPSIATDDRPYSISDSKLFHQALIESKKMSNSNSKQKIEINRIASISKSIIQENKKPTTNWQQTDNKPTTNWQQTDNKLTTNWQQTDNKLTTNRQQTDNQTGNQTDNKLATNWQQTDNKLTTEIVFSELMGLQRNVIIFIYQECKNSRSKITEALNLKYISDALGCSTGVAKTTIQRLEKKGCLMRVKFKNGRGGWSKYELPDTIYNNVLRSETNNKLTTNWQQTDNKLATKPTTKLATNYSSSSSVLNIKETTTKLNDEWNFDITPYVKFGFTTSQLKQLISLGTILASDVEQSLIEFNHDLINNTLPTIKTGKINFLMGLLRSGHLYVSESFKNEQEAAILEMAKRAADKRKKLLEAKFEDWESKLNDIERKNIKHKIPMSLRVMFDVHGINNLEVKNWLFNFYCIQKEEITKK